MLSRTDSIGDVILTLPLAGLIKSVEPDCKITFLGKAYTEAVVALSVHVDAFVDWGRIEQLPPTKQVTTFESLNADVFVHVFPVKEIAKLAKRAGIKDRIGTSHRSYHLLTCNHRPSFTRKKSDLHEAQLNCKLLAPLGIVHIPEIDSLADFYGFTRVPELPEKFGQLLSADKRNIILHPKSKGSAVEWGLNNFSELMEVLSEEPCHVFVTGTEEEGQLIRDQLPLNLPNVTDVTGQMTLPELIAFIAHADALVAASTGPLHIAAALGLRAVGLFSQRRPIHPGRWQPIGKNAIAIVYHGEETKSGDELDRQMKLIDPELIASKLMGLE